jgi:hypothetical protein
VRDEPFGFISQLTNNEFPPNAGKCQFDSFACETRFKPSVANDGFRKLAASGQGHDGEYDGWLLTGVDMDNQEAAFGGRPKPARSSHVFAKSQRLVPPHTSQPGQRKRPSNLMVRIDSLHHGGEWPVLTITADRFGHVVHCHD